MTQHSESALQGFRLFSLESGDVVVKVIPELGAKILSLQSKSTGREWMWSSSSPVKLHRNRLGDLFTQSTLAGADECLPTISACRWRGRDLPDHGEAWSMPWDCEIQDERLVTTLRLPTTPLTITRSLTLDLHVLTLDYQLDNRSDEILEYLWAFHPLITQHAGDKLVASCTQVRCDPAFSGKHLPWPYPVAQGDEIKSFATDLSAGVAGIENADTGDFLRFEFDRDELPYLGLLENRGRWGGHHFFAIEPTTGQPDDLSIAVNDWNCFATIQPHGTKKWKFNIRCS